MALDRNVRYTVAEVLAEAGVSAEYSEKAGHGLNVGGLNVSSLDQTLRIPEAATVLHIVAPGLDLVEVSL